MGRSNKQEKHYCTIATDNETITTGEVETIIVDSDHNMLTCLTAVSQ